MACSNGNKQNPTSQNWHCSVLKASHPHQDCSHHHGHHVLFHPLSSPSSLVLYGRWQQTCGSYNHPTRLLKWLKKLSWADFPSTMEWRLSADLPISELHCQYMYIIYIYNMYIICYNIIYLYKICIINIHVCMLWTFVYHIYIL